MDGKLNIREDIRGFFDCALSMRILTSRFKFFHFHSYQIIMKSQLHNHRNLSHRILLMPAARSRKDTDIIDDQSRSSAATCVSVSTDRSCIQLLSSGEILIFSTNSYDCIGRCSLPRGLRCRAAHWISGTSIAAVATESGFQLWDVSADRAISPFVQLREKVLSIFANRSRVILLSVTKLLVFSLADLEMLYAVDRDPTIGEAGQNLLAGTEEGLCAFLTSDNVVQVIDTITLFQMQPIRCHTSPVTAIEIRDKILVTGSSKGTIIRVFALPSMKLIALFRRGRTETPLRSLFITEDQATQALVIVATGDSDTAHLYRVAPDELICSTEGEISMVGSMMSFLPKPYKDAVEAARDFAFIRLRRDAPLKYLAAMVDHKRVAVIAEETGFVFVYEVNVNKGGECRLVSEHDLLSQAAEFRPQTVPVKSSTAPTVEEVPIIERPSSFESSQTSLKPSSPVIESISHPSENSSAEVLPPLNDPEEAETDPFPMVEVKKKKKKKKAFENQISEAA